MSQKEFYEKYWINQHPDIDPQTAYDRSRERAQIALQLISKRSVNLLEVGCGDGIASEFFQDAGFKVKGIDIASAAVEMARKKGIDAEVFDIEKSPMPGGNFNVVVCFEVLEHLLNPGIALYNIGRSITDKSELIVSLPNEFHIIRRILILLGRPGSIGYNIPHVRFFDQKSALKFFSDNGFKAAIVAPVNLVPVRYKYLRWLGRLLSRINPNLFALQFVFKLEKIDKSSKI